MHDTRQECMHTSSIIHIHCKGHHALADLLQKQLQGPAMIQLSANNRLTGTQHTWCKPTFHEHCLHICLAARQNKATKKQLQAPGSLAIPYSALQLVQQTK
jgi:hypothetical protein